MVFTIPQVHVVVMITHGKEISGTGFLEKGYQPLRIPFLGFPFVDYILEAEFRRMSVMLQVPLEAAPPSSYMPRPYQSPASGWHCGPQCAHMPNLALRNHSGTSYWDNDSQVGENLPGSAFSCCANALPPCRMQADRRIVLKMFLFIPLLLFTKCLFPF